MCTFFLLINVCQYASKSKEVLRKALLEAKDNTKQLYFFTLMNIYETFLKGIALLLKGFAHIIYPSSF